jgi:hypothetical protein
MQLCRGFSGWRLFGRRWLRWHSAHLDSGHQPDASRACGTLERGDLSRLLAGCRMHSVGFLGWNNSNLECLTGEREHELSGHMGDILCKNYRYFSGFLLATYNCNLNLGDNFQYLLTSFIGVISETSRVYICWRHQHYICLGSARLLAQRGAPPYT